MNRVPRLSSVIGVLFVAAVCDTAYAGVPRTAPWASAASRASARAFGKDWATASAEARRALYGLSRRGNTASAAAGAPAGGNLFAPGNSQTTTAEQIAQLAGQAQYASQFAGAVFTGSTVAVSVTADSAALESALAADFPSGSYTLDTVSTSLDTLEADSIDMATGSSLNVYGSPTSPFELVSLAPVADDTVQATVIGDTALALSTLRRLYPTVPLSVVEDPDPLGPMMNATYTRSSDLVGDWTDGDNANSCGDSFSFDGLGSGNLYQYTANHCVSGVGETISNGGHTLGHITTVYTPAATNSDMASIQCNTCDTSNVYYNNTGGSYFVEGDCGDACENKGVSLTMDPAAQNGFAGNEASGFLVQWTGPGEVLIAEPNGNSEPGGNYWVMGLEYAKNSPGIEGCYAGASGSPVYQRQPNGSVLAAGMIIGHDPGYDNQCYYEVTTWIEGKSNSFLWG